MDRKADEARKFLEEDFQRRNRDAQKITFKMFYVDDEPVGSEKIEYKSLRDDKRADGAKFF